MSSQRSSQGWLLNKISYGLQIKGYFARALAACPEMPETHLGIGTFYLLAPSIVGGNLMQAKKELSTAYMMAPDFATVNARLAQLYKKQGDLQKYNYYLERTKELDSENEVLKEVNN